LFTALPLPHAVGSKRRLQLLIRYWKST